MILYHEVTEAEEIKYLDICSLYPYICKYGIFPIGHPVILTKEQIYMDRIREYEGVIKCMILPLSNLYHPVLPFRNDKGKLLFPLCRKFEDDKTVECRHSEVQRALVGTRITIEVFATLDRGYRLLDMFEEWHFEDVSHYSKETGDKTLFGGYVDTFVKLKTESSGLPDDCSNQDIFWEEFYKKEGMRLDKLKNKRMTALCKSILNKNWGILAQRDNLNTREYVHSKAC